MLYHAAELSQMHPNWATAAHTWIFVLSMQDDAVHYYMVDHRARAIFWVHDMPFQLAQPHDQDWLRLYPPMFVHPPSY